MDKMKNVLEGVKDGSLSIDSALKELEKVSYSDLNYAKIDYGRKKRVGYGEVIYCENKEIPHIVGIIKNMLEHGSFNILATRASKEAYEAVSKITDEVEYDELARIMVIKRREIEKPKTKIAVVTGGTSDYRVAEEAAMTAEVLGNDVERFYDVGVAGLHRLMANIDAIREARVVITVAGMEGALTSVVGGLVDKPVIGVPTSVGYGASFDGLAALLSMLNSCSSGVSVVNIDNGFGAGYLASMINQL